MIVGTIPELIEKARDLLRSRIQTVIRLTPGGRFEPVPVVPEFAWLEGVVNAVAHRSYSLQGDGIRVTDFDDRLEIESPGRLPGLVRVQNIQNCRFSRNPHIARVLAENTGFVRELNEGVKRMFDEMVRSGLNPPRYSIGEASVRVTLSKHPQTVPREQQLEARAVWAGMNRRLGATSVFELVASFHQKGQIRTGEAALVLGVTPVTARNNLKKLEQLGMIREVARSPRDPASVWKVVDSPLWREWL